MVPVIYFLGGVLVRATTKRIAQRLVAKGFRKATKGQISSKIKIVDGTENNLISLMTRALKAVKELTGRPVSNNPKNLGGSKITTAGGRGQSELGRRIALSKLKSRGKVGPKSTSFPKKVPKKPLDGPKPISTTSIPNRLAQGLNIAAVGSIGKVAYDVYKDREVANKKFEEARRARSDLSAAKDKRSLARKVRATKNFDEAKNTLALANKKLEKQITKILTPKEQAAAADTPARRKAIMRLLKEAMAFKSENNKGK